MLRFWQTYSVHIVWLAVVIFSILGLLTIHPIYADICAKDTQTGQENCARYHILMYTVKWIADFSHNYHGILTALATAFIAWFTWTLRQSTDKLWEAGERQLAIAQKTANAADLSARAAIGLQLPIFRAHPASLGHGQPIDNGIKREDCWVHFVEFTNHGNSKAFPVEVHYGVIVGNGHLPKEPVFIDTLFFEVNATYEPGTTEPYRVFLPNGAGVLKEGEWANICKGELCVTFYCRLVYLDFIDTRREVSFCWRWGEIWRHGHEVDARWHPRIQP